MAEEVKPVRLSKAAKEVNVSVSTIVEFLGKKGHTVDSNPNTKLTGEQYTMVLKEFQSDKVISEKAQELTLETVPRKEKAPVAPKEKESVKEAVKEPITPEPAKGSEGMKVETSVSIEKQEKRKEDSEPAEVSDKNLVRDAEPQVEPVAEPEPEPKEVATEAPEKAIEVPEQPKEELEPEPVQEESSKPEEVAGEPEPVEPEPVEKTSEVMPVEAEKTPEPVKADSEAKGEEAAEKSRKEEPAKPDADKEKSKGNIFAKGLTHISGPKIVSTMDAHTLKLAQQGKAVKPDKIERPQIIEPEPVPEPKPVEKVEKKEDNFVKTEYVKLAGPV